jgi:site-specific DNA-cytosine methylase
MQRLRVLELFAGIGGCAVALSRAVEQGAAQIVAAVDIDRRALSVYQHNFVHPVCVKTIESLPEEWLRAQDAGLWWLSPPCQPFSRRGRQRDVDDPRCAALLAMTEHIGSLRPRFVALENVPEFHGSLAYQRFRERLLAARYKVLETVVCPSQFGLPNRRRRFYLLASHSSLPQWRFPDVARARPLHEFLDASPDVRMILPPALVARYRAAVHVVDASSDTAMTGCFTAAYGRSLVRSGSYVSTRGSVRRFTPGEILRLLGFPQGFTLPTELEPRHAWPLVGNSLSVPVVRSILDPILA